MSDPVPILKRIMKSPYFTKKDAPMVGSFQPGDGRVVLVTGENGSGKSFFSRLAAFCFREEKVEDMRIGMDFRTTSDIRRSFVYNGMEDDSSTGYLSMTAIQGGISTCKKRQNDHVLIFDEPDIGLSESWQGAVGKMFAAMAKELPDKTRMLMLVTHSRRIARHMLPLKPHHIRLGDEKTLAEFMEEPVEKEAEDLEGLQKSCHEMYLKIEKEIQAVRSGKAKKAK